jgi:hypothetical protein
VGLLTKGNQKMIRRAAGSTGADEGLPPVNSPQITPPNLWERIQKWWIYVDCHGFMKQEYCNQAMKKIMMMRNHVFWGIGLRKQGSMG